MLDLTRFIKANWRALASVGLLVCGLAGLGLSSAAPGDSNVRTTRHNLSKSGTPLSSGGFTRPLATTETQVCVFCHTPHNAMAGKAPLWNRAANAQTYTRYTSASLDANSITDGFSAQPGGSSLLCLSCHDGMVALGDVGNLPGTAAAGGTIAMSAGATGDGKMPTNYGVNTGFTRLGTDLTNDHPISITYNDALAVADGELARMDSSQKDLITGGALIGIRQSGSTPPLLPLERTGAAGGDGKALGQVQCATCHDPHITKDKFLRLNRLQANASPSGGAFNQNNDIICLACHTKLGTAWAQSAHADSTVADETYTAAAAALRNFPTGTKVWQGACLNCHDTHTVQGSRRLLREGVNGLDADLVTVPSGPAAGAVYRPGFAPQAVDGTDGNNRTSAVENTCFQCHRDPGGINAIVAATGTVPKIKSLFDQTYGMPARSADQADPNDKERHNIINADLMEPQANLGRGDTTARHAECPDCHNPHRLVRNSRFYISGGDNTKRTHDTVGNAGILANVASGVLRGGWGVQPVYSNISARVWPQLPDSFDIKKGDPGANTSTAKTQSYLTREYQLCFKCHSNYANGDTAASFPAIGYAAALRGTSRRGTPLTYSNGMLNYTNVMAEFASVNAGEGADGLALTNTDQGEKSNVGTACTGNTNCDPSGSNDGTPTWNGTSNNHRSWHPVMYPTGRDRAERNMGGGNTNIRPPFEANIGKQTMQCNDCHGQGSSYTPGVGPIDTEPQGPHGSSYPFLLRGDWSLSTTKIGSLTNQICGYCHRPGSGNQSGFGTSHNGGGQGAMNNAPCMFCHIAVPHGWKNKAFLVNMNCVGAEGGQAGTCVAVKNSNPTIPGASSSYTASYLPPYYNGSKIRISTWPKSGSWQCSSCTGSMTSCSSSY